MAADWIRHEDRLELRVVASTQEQIYREVTSRFGGLLERRGGQNGDMTADRLPVLVRAGGDRPLLAEYLEDLLYLVEVEHFAPVRLERLSIDGERLRAAVSGWTGDWSIDLYTALTAAVSFDRGAQAWLATVSFPKA